MARMRLDKYIAQLGVTRKQAKGRIARGEVRVNGQVCTDPGHIVDDGVDQVSSSGQSVAPPGEMYLMLNKSAGLLSATRDGRGAGTVMELLPEAYQSLGLSPVGRLDKDVTGLLFMTTDGQLLHRLISPRWQVEKEYIAVVEGALDAGDVQAFAQGIRLTDFTALPARLSIDERDSAVGRVVVTEGKYHQVKRMFGARGKPVLQLHRSAFGGIALDEDLAPGQWRALTPGEISRLKTITNLD